MYFYSMNLQGTNMNHLGIRYSDVHFSPFTKHFILDAYHNPEHNDTHWHKERHLGIYSFYWYTTSEEPMPHGVPFE